MATTEEYVRIDHHLDGLKPGATYSLVLDGHRFYIVATDVAGIHTGRHRLCVACLTCHRLMHEATTGALTLVQGHIAEVAAQRQLARQLAGEGGTDTELMLVKDYRERLIEMNKANADLRERLDRTRGERDYYQKQLAIAEPLSKERKPIEMRLSCPKCGELHIDTGAFATKPHHTHACQACGMVWRPAVVDTVGVQFLPGYKNGADS